MIPALFIRMSSRFCQPWEADTASRSSFPVGDITFQGEKPAPAGSDRLLDLRKIPPFAADSDDIRSRFRKPLCHGFSKSETGPRHHCHGAVQPESIKHRFHSASNHVSPGLPRSPTSEKEILRKRPGIFGLLAILEQLQGLAQIISCQAVQFRKDFLAAVVASIG